MYNSCHEQMLLCSVSIMLWSYTVYYVLDIQVCRELSKTYQSQYTVKHTTHAGLIELHQ